MPVKAMSSGVRAQLVVYSSCQRFLQDLSDAKRVQKLQTLLERVKSLKDDDMDEEVVRVTDDPFAVDEPSIAERDSSRRRSHTDAANTNSARLSRALRLLKGSERQVLNQQSAEPPASAPQKEATRDSSAQTSKLDVPLPIRISDPETPRRSESTEGTDMRTSFLSRVGIPHHIKHLFFGDDEDPSERRLSSLATEQRDTEKGVLLPMTQSFYANLMFSPEELARLQVCIPMTAAFYIVRTLCKRACNFAFACLQQNMADLQQQNLRLKAENNRLKDQIDDFLQKALDESAGMLLHNCTQLRNPHACYRGSPCAFYFVCEISENNQQRTDSSIRFAQHSSSWIALWKTSVPSVNGSAPVRQLPNTALLGHSHLVENVLWRRLAGVWVRVLEFTARHT
jgi:hypothetical protein